MTWDADRITVFSGPSLPGWQAASPFVRLPPAGAGDMLALVEGPAHTLVLIDGVFDLRPAVWHKEVLLLLSRGFRVIGAASMGALRAAELASFGMIGCGAIYRAYARGHLTADDEVAVTHAPDALGARPLSLALVDVRASLVVARRRGAIDTATARRIAAAAAAIHYKDRTWPAVIAAAERPDLGETILRHAFSLKTRDAEDAFVLAASLSGQPPARCAAPPITTFVERLVRFVAPA